MSPPRLSAVALCLAASLSSVVAGTGGSFADGGNTLISALMMFLGNEESVYILDKAEANAAQINGHPAWGALWDIQSHQTIVMDIKTNSFCASGMHLPNGSFASFGGNDGVTVNGAAGSQKNPDGTGAWDSVYQDFDGRKAIRVVNPCRSTDNLASAQCGWFDDPIVLSMKRARWYSAVEATGDGTIVILGGFTRGGYINRWFPVTDPITQSGQAENTYEFYPARDGDPPVVQFLVKASGLNAYAHTFLMPSGKMLVQANYSTMLWDYNSNTETDLPDMPNHIARVYPASGATAMLPLTPDNNYTPTLLFCGGSDIPPDSWGGYDGPYVDTWKIPASKDCQRLTPEPQDGSAPAYQQDDDMLEGRTMGQFIILPDGKLLVINGGAKGTAGYTLGTADTPGDQMPFGTSLAASPVMTPALYNPKAPKGSRWTNQGLGASIIPRLYHSTAILLPDASVLVAGSNPNPDVNISTFFNTEYRAEIFYPPYFSASVRPAPVGVPSTLSYGGSPFDITIPSTSYSGLANDAADATTVVIVRGGFTTHAMNMGQRHMQLNSTYTVDKNGSITVHVSQPPPNANLFQPGPALLFVNIKGIPSNGTYVIIGNGVVGAQPTAPASVLPASVRLDSVSGGTGSAGSDSNPGGSTAPKKSNLAVIIGGIAGAVALIALIGGAIALCLVRRRRAARLPPSKNYALGAAGAPISKGPFPSWTSQDGDPTVFIPLAKSNYDDAWDPTTASIQAPYKDERPSLGSRSQFDHYDPYSGYPAQAHAENPEQYPHYQQP
ncbi:hypothetical protein GALMADRAFT_237321 [Galerina marginata CBS 339.88]|uniref:Galactose oxidase-like Early set domain-containing protein n=1 Tax=Galerina marginata (strain CBS 339.88) TaxID=685588 RepID=A0A067TMU5_GALM3|nr:hypothetical protein GALMADRAFT_237321 [Galerina marginata CBS 339.88]